METLLQTEFKNLNLAARGKVRDIYEFADSFLIVVTDRISAFDFIMSRGIPDKGKILNQIAAFWFNETKHIIPNHVITTDVNDFPAECNPYAKELQGRSMLVRKAEPFPVEFVARGYIAGSGWKEYQNSGKVVGIELPEGLQEFDKLPEPIFTPATKAVSGHDININFDETTNIIGKKTAEHLRKLTLQLYTYAHDYLFKRGIILADTKFEFGRLPNGEIILIDEALTPDSSRFWLLENYAPGKFQTNFDKQVLRDWLESSGWNKMPPPPELPDDVVLKTREKYLDAFRMITGSELK